MPAPLITFIIADDAPADSQIKSVGRRCIDVVCSQFNLTPPEKKLEYLDGITLVQGYMELKEKQPNQEVILILDGEMGGDEKDGDVALRKIRAAEKQFGWTPAYVIAHSSSTEKTAKMLELEGKENTVATNKLPTLLQKHLRDRIKTLQTASTVADVIDTDTAAASAKTSPLKVNLPESARIPIEDPVATEDQFSSIPSNLKPTIAIEFAADTRCHNRPLHKALSARTLVSSTLWGDTQAKTLTLKRLSASHTTFYTVPTSPAGRNQSRCSQDITAIADESPLSTVSLSSSS